MHLMTREKEMLTAMQASMASGVVDICLIPEVNFVLDGKEGLLAYLDGRLAQRGHAVICMAEGAGQVPTPNFLWGLENLRLKIVLHVSIMIEGERFGICCWQSSIPS